RLATTLPSNRIGHLRTALSRDFPAFAAAAARSMVGRRTVREVSSLLAAAASSSDFLIRKSAVQQVHSRWQRKLKVSDMAKVAFLGLGVMGFPMAGHLVAKGGHEVTVFNRTAAKSKAWAEKFGGKVASTPKAAAEGQ